MFKQRVRVSGLYLAILAVSVVGGATVFAQPSEPAATPPVAPTRAATVADIEAMYAAGEFRLALQQISRILPAAPPSTRAQLFFLRGQSLLQLDDIASARLALDMVDREAARAPATDELRLISARARADRILIEMSRAGRVTLSGREPVAIADPAARAGLYALIFEERMAALTPDVQRAQSANDLPTIRNLLPRVYDVHSLEIAATGNDTRTAEIYRSLGARARLLIDRELQLMNTRVISIRDAASRTESFVAPRVTGTWWSSTAIRRGLHSTDRDALRQILGELGRINEVSDQARAYAVSLGRVPQGWDDLITRTRVLAEMTQGVLDGE